MQEEIVPINTDTIKLVQLLKLSNFFSTGGQAKILISEGEVLVNGEVENRIRRQIKPGDIVELNGQIVLKVVRE